jgi:hypothetical protein
VFEFPAEAAEVAEGTVPSAPRLMSAPLSEPLATLEPLTALRAILPVVTDLDLSWREPTEFLPSVAAARAEPPVRSRNRQSVEMTLA